jgi:hypothetical protein
VTSSMPDRCRPTHVDGWRMPHRSDERRTALPEALDDFRRHGQLGRATVADVTARAHVTRFELNARFQDVAAAVTVLGSGMYRDAVAAADHLSDGGTPPRERPRKMIDGMFDAWRRHHHLYRTALAASYENEALRGLWEGYRHSFVRPIASAIEAERAAGRAPPGAGATLLAVMLLDLLGCRLERLTPNDTAAVTRAADSLAAAWLRAIYG